MHDIFILLSSFPGGIVPISSITLGTVKNGSLGERELDGEGESESERERMLSLAPTCMYMQAVL